MSFHKWEKDFSKARNFALDQIPEEYEWLVWMDTDDVIEGGKYIRDVIESGADCIYCTYNYEIDEKGRVLKQHPRERIVKRKLFKWGAQGLPVGSLHENLTPIKQVRNIFANEIVWNHYPEKTNEQDKNKRNLEILEEAYKKEGKEHDPRTEYYLARAYFDFQKWKEAEDLFYSYLEKSGWDEERGSAKNYLGEIYRVNGKPREALECYFSAIKEKHNIPAYYINLGMAYADLEEWDPAVHYTKIGLKMPQPKSAMVVTPIDDQIRALDTLYRAFMATRKIKEAHAVSKEMYEITGKKWAKKQMDFAWDILRWTEMSKEVGTLLEELNDLKEEDKIQQLLLSLPSTISDNGYISQLKQKYVKPKVWPEKSIVYFVGRGVEPWDETSTAIGGSETAVIQLTKNWSKDGYDVTVFGDPKTEHTDENGVHWVEWYKFNPMDTFDTIINWRNPDLTHLKANKKILDLHDVPSYIDFNPTILKAIDHILIKSEYHKRLITEPEAREKCVVISNGYTPYAVEQNHDNKKIIYSSSYDRGLEYLLKWGWPIVKKDHPDAELHIYYGWNTFDVMTRGNPERRMWKEKMLELLKQEGVYEHGRIDQKKLLQEKAKAKIHWYPCTFEEIDCISVRESAAVGCIPVVTDYAVFTEKPYVIMGGQNPRDKRTQEDLAKKVSELLGQDTKEISKAQKKLASQETWENVSRQWEELVFSQ